jgi:hypothetical protein
LKKDKIHSLIGFTGNLSPECNHQMCNAPVCIVDSDSLVNCYTMKGEKYCPVALDYLEGKEPPEEIARAVSLNMAAWKENVGESVIGKRLESRRKVRQTFSRSAA